MSSMNIECSILQSSALIISSEDYWFLLNVVPLLLQVYLKYMEILANPFVFVKNTVISNDC